MTFFQNLKKKFHKDHGDGECSQLAANQEHKLKSIEKAMAARSWALKELVDSEVRYVSSLSLIVDKYLYEIRNQNTGIPLPKDLNDEKLRLVFSNIEEIYKWHKELVFCIS